MELEKEKKDWRTEYVNDLQEWTDWDKQYDEKVTMLYIALEKFIKSTTFNKKGKKIKFIEDGVKYKLIGCDCYEVPLSEEEKLLWEKHNRLFEMLKDIIQYDAIFDCEHFGVKNKMLYCVKSNLQHTSIYDKSDE